MAGPSAFACTLATARAGNPEAMFETAVAYHNGLGVPRDLAQSTNWYREAAERGHPIAISAMIRAYRFGEGVPPDLAKAVHWELAAANRGNVNAMGELVRAYRLGEGAAKDPAEANRWLERYRAAAPGSPDPAGPPEDLEKYWKHAAERASTDAAVAAQDAERAANQERPH